MLQQDSPDDYVICTGNTYSVREFVLKAFDRVGITLKFEGEGVKEVGINQKDVSFGRTNIDAGHVLVRIDPKYYRPNEIDCLHGSYNKAYLKLGWKPKIDFNTLVNRMVDHDTKGLL